MADLNRVPLEMVRAGANAQAADQVIFNGVALETQNPRQAIVDIHVIAARYDVETGTLVLVNNDGSQLSVGGFLTNGNIGRGPKGEPGIQGRPGMNGLHGRDGVNGERGCQGPRGFPGLDGPEGPPGPRGAQGAPGLPGTQGEKGDKGDRGTDGVSPTFHIGDVASYMFFGDSGPGEMWGRFTDNTPGMQKQMQLPYTIPANRRAVLTLQWINPAANVAHKVKVTSVTGNTAIFDVVPALLNGLEASGWDFYWRVRY